MVVIFGFGAGEPQDHGEAAPTVCPNCHNVVYLHHIRSEKKFSLYFVPLIPYGSDEYLLCPVCRHGMQLQAQQVPLVKQMCQWTAMYRRGQFAGDYQATVDGFWRQLGGAPGGAPAVSAPASPATSAPSAHRPAPPPRAAHPPPAGSPSTTTALEGIARLHRSGALTDEEFAAMKKRILGV